MNLKLKLFAPLALVTLFATRTASWADAPAKVTFVYADSQQARQDDLIELISNTTNAKEVADKDYEGKCDRLPTPIASILVPEVAKQALDLVTPPPAGESTVLRLSFPGSMITGFSEISRAASINEIAIDPVDIPIWQESDKSTLSWYNWRRAKFATLVGQYFEKVPSKAKTVAVDASWPTSSPLQKATTAEDWPAWAKGQLIDRVILESEWENPKNKLLVGMAKTALEKTNVKVLIALDLRRDGKPVDPLGQLLNLQGEKFDGVVVKVENDADLPRAKAFVKDVLPEFQFGL